jgi:hypothetical protein
MNRLQKDLTLYRKRVKPDQICFTLHTLPYKRGVSFDVFLQFFQALCSNSEMRCEHSSTIEYHFENDLIGTYEMSKGEVYHTDHSTMDIYDIKCPSRPDYVVYIQSHTRRKILVPHINSMKLLSTTLKESWVFHLDAIKYVLVKSVTGPVKDDIPNIDPRFDIDMTSSNVWNLMDLFGRFDESGQEEKLSPIIVKKS